MSILLGQGSVPDEMPRDWVLRFSPPWPVAVTVLVAIGAATCVCWLYLRSSPEVPLGRRVLLASLRLTLVALLLLLMYGPAIHPYRVEPPALVLLLDNSASMSLTDQEVATADRAFAGGRAQRPKTMSRWEQAMALLLESRTQWLRRWQSDYRLQIQTLDGVTLPDRHDSKDLVSHINRIQPVVPSTRLGAIVQGVLAAQRGRSTAAIVILTDGNTTEGARLSEVAAQAARQRIPLFPVGIGRRQPPADLALSDLVVEPVVFVNDLVAFDVAVSARGLAGRSVQVILRSEQDGTEWDRETIVVPSGEDVQRVRLWHRPPNVGRLHCLLQAEVLEGESRSDNNQLRAVVQVRDEQIRVLLVQSAPSFEFRYLQALMDRKPRPDSPVELVTILQEADPEPTGAAGLAESSVAWNRESLRSYDVVIWGDVNPGLFSASALQDVVDLIREDGRGLVIAAGPRFGPRAVNGTPMESLLPFAVADLPSVPVGETGCALRLTPLGMSMPHMQLAVDRDDNLQIWHNLPRCNWFLPVGPTRPGVRVLATAAVTGEPTAKMRPLIVLQYVGAGKVVFHATDETYRWRFRQGDTWFARYWLQTLRLLSRSKLVEEQPVVLQVEHDEYQQGDPARIRVSFRDDRLAPTADNGVSVLLQRSDGRQQRVTLNRRSAERGEFDTLLPPLEAGDYHAWVADPAAAEPAACDFTVLASDPERRHVAMNQQDLQRAADLSGGEFYGWEEAAGLIDRIPSGQAMRVESLTPQPIWNSWLIAVLFIGLLLSEWLLRRRFGLN